MEKSLVMFPNKDQKNNEIATVERNSKIEGFEPGLWQVYETELMITSNFDEFFIFINLE